MTSEGHYKNRQLIPRWNVSRTAFGIGDSLDLHGRSHSRTEHPLLSKKKNTWNVEQSTWSGIDYLGTALVLHSLDDPAVFEAVHRLSTFRLSGSQLAVLEAIRGDGESAPTDTEDIAHALRLVPELRQRLRKNPRDAISWIDLAYLCELHGASRRAERHIRTAVDLAPDNRLVLRSMARFYTHREDPETALHYLRRSRFLPRDPWLLSAEISISEIQGSRSKYIRVARRLSDSLDTSPFNKSELLGALSTVEFCHATSKKLGRRWLREALVDPNENTLAQAEHLISNHNLGLDLDGKEAPLDHEVRTRRAYWAQSFDEAVSHARRWAQYQPLSSGPLVAGSFLLLTMIDDPIGAIEFIRSAERHSTYSDPMVVNNLACALASAGRVEEARRELRRVSGSEVREGEETALTATRGLVAFREGNIQAGIENYERALEALRSTKDYERVALASIFFGRELALCGDKRAASVLEGAANIIKAHNLPHVHHSATRLLSGIGRAESVFEEGRSS